MSGPDPKAIEHLLVLVEEKARGIVRYGLLFSGGREESLDPPHEDARVQDVAVALTSP